MEDTTCGGCGGDLHRTLEAGEVYDVDTETVCHSCAALEMVRRDDQKKYAQEKEVAGRFTHGDGRIYTVRPLDSNERRRL